MDYPSAALACSSLSQSTLKCQWTTFDRPRGLLSHFGLFDAAANVWCGSTRQARSNMVQVQQMTKGIGVYLLVYKLKLL